MPAEKVLLIGYRKQCADALHAMGVPFSVWHDRKVKTALTLPEFFHAPFPSSRTEIEKIADQMSPWGPFSHVIASVERSVYVATIMRRALNARKSKHTVILRCHDKLKMKDFLVQKGIPMTRFMHFRGEVQSDAVSAILGTPVVVKDRRSSGGRGIKIHDDIEQIARDTDASKILEAFIDGEEISVESFVSDKVIQFTNITSYYRKGKVNIVPASLPEELEEAILDLNRLIIEELNINWGLTHAEYYLTEEKILFGEIALRPPGGYIMELISEAYGFDAWKTFCEVELGRQINLPSHHRKITAAYILTSKEGELYSIQGLEKVDAHPSVFKLVVKKKVGDTIKPRLGIGSDNGYVLLWGDSLAGITEAIEFIDKTLHFDVRAAKHD